MFGGARSPRAVDDAHPLEKMADVARKIRQIGGIMQADFVRKAVRSLLVATIISAVGHSAAAKRAENDCVYCTGCSVGGEVFHCCQHFAPSGWSGCFAVGNESCTQWGEFCARAD